MRQAGTIENEAHARRFADYLTTHGVECRVDREPGGWGIWVHDEDRLAEVRQALDEFVRQPDDLRYQGVEQSARKLRQEAQRREERIRKNFIDVRKGWDRASAPASCPATFVLFAASVLITAVASFQDIDGPVPNMMWIAPIQIEGPFLQFNGLEAIRQGEVWRLVTPIFLHARLRLSSGIFIMHLVFNMYWLMNLGSLIESRRGTARFSLMVLVMAVASNLGHYWATGNPLFGGMSGVLYGLFGYAWMKTRYDPRGGIFLDEGTVSIMLIWFVLCWIGLIGNIANWAHTVGLLTGMAIGYSPRLARNLARRLGRP
jgi:GlpG protein